jgi:molybdate transport system substrate-binding protein
MDALEDGGFITSRRVFAENALALIVPSDNPARLSSLRDLPLASRLVMGTRETPAGQYAERLLDNADSQWGAGFKDAVLRKVVSREHNVRLVRAKVELGEADAAIVYETDAHSGKGVFRLPIPPTMNVRGAYHVGEIRRDHPNQAARAWMEFLFSPTGQAILRESGFSVEAEDG